MPSGSSTQRHRSLRAYLSRSRHLVIANYILENSRIRRRLQEGHFDHSEGATHRGWDSQTSAAYIDRVFADYIHYGGQTDLTGQSVLELGPGDNLGIALRYIASGAERVICLDKFRAIRDPQKEREIYAAIRSNLNNAERVRFDDAVSLSKPEIEFNSHRIAYHYGTGIEHAGDIFQPGSFDHIVSCAVLMGVTDLDRAFLTMDQLLKPGGMLIHKVDVTDVGMFSSGGFHPLEFLCISATVYSLMTSDSGRSNRKMVDYYREKVRSLGYQGRILATRVRGEAQDLPEYTERLGYGQHYGEKTREMIAGKRSRLLSRYKGLSEEDLAIGGILLCARKPPADDRDAEFARANDGEEC